MSRQIPKYLGQGPNSSLSVGVSGGHGNVPGGHWRTGEGNSDP